MADDAELLRARRGLFGIDATAYDVGRPGYPDRVYELLQDPCGLRTGTRVLEVGPGTGQTTGRMLDLGATVTAVELSERLAERLQEKFEHRALEVTVGAFEDVELAQASFDLVVAATSWHWITVEVAVDRVARALRNGGWLAVWWSVFGDPERADPFHDALTPLLLDRAPELHQPMERGSPGTGAHSHGLDAAARIAELEQTGEFVVRHHEVVPWVGRHHAAELRAMFASFSPWLALPPARRNRLLDDVERLADTEFHGIVERPYLTPIYLAQRVDG